MQRIGVLAVLVSALTATRLGAQALVDRVPGDAIAYVGWTGTASPDSHFTGSVTAKVLEAIDVAQTADRVAAMVAAMTQGKGVDPATIQAVRDAAAAAWRDPFAVYVRPGDPDAAGVEVGMIWRVGDGSQNLVPQLRRLVKQAPPNMHLQMSEQNGHVILTLPPSGGPGTPRPNAMLSTSTAFQQALQATGATSPALVAYVDADALRATLEAQAARTGDDEQVRQLTQALGLDGLRHALYAGRFTEAGQWETRLFVAAPAPRQGLLAALMDRPALDRAALAAVPGTATWAKAFELDLGQVVEAVREALRDAEPDAAEAMDRGMIAAGAAAGVDLERDVMQALGHTWMVYSDPAVTGPGAMGLVIVNDLAKAEAAERALLQLQDFAEQQMREDGAGPAEMRFDTLEQDGLTMHALVTPICTPAWAIADGNLYVAVLPQALMVAHDYARQPGDTILDSTAFEHVSQLLGAPAFSSLTVIDLKQTAPATYQQYVMGAQMLSGMLATQVGDPQVGSLGMLLPPLNRILPLLEPAGSMGWTDDAGFHWRSTSPFIGATMLSPTAMTSLPAASLGVGILLPALGSARTTAKRMQSNTQMRGIHQASVMWAQGHDSQMSGDVGELLEGNYFTPEYLLSPWKEDSLPGDIGDWTDAERMTWARQHTSFVLVPGLRETLDSEEIAGFGVPGDFQGGIPVVYNDNHVVWIQEPEIPRIAQTLREQTGMSMQDVIDHQRAVE